MTELPLSGPPTSMTFILVGGENNGHIYVIQVIMVVNQ